MSLPIIASVGHGSTALWYLTRATGLVSLIALSGSVVLGIVSSVGWASERWPRFLSQSVHRNVSLFAVALVFVHVVTTVADGYVPISVADAVIPFRSPYRPIWIGLGACAFDVLLAVTITSGLRRHIGYRVWRTIHWLSYLCWPVALVHGLGSGTDTRLPGVQFVYLLCTLTVIGAFGWRLVTGRAMTSGWRIGAAVTGTFALFAVALFAFSGPFLPGWSRRAGTSSALLARLSHAAPVSAVSPSNGSTTSTTSPATVPGAPFSSALSGSYSVSGPDAAGQVRVVLSMRVQSDGLPLVVTLMGPAVDGGVSMTSSSVSFGTMQGAVTLLEGSTIDVAVSGAGRSENLTLQVALNRANRTVSGTVSGASGAPTAAREGSRE